ncbi:MAG: hypothetical protein ACRCX8_04490 [Sarcina sp.]
MNKKIVALSIGSSYITAALAQENNGEFELLDNVIRPSKGIKKGRVVDVDLTVESVIAILQELSTKNNEMYDSMYVSLPLSDVRVINSKGNFESNKEIIVTKREITETYVKAKQIKINDDEYIIDAIIQGFYVNGEGYINDPLNKNLKNFEMDLDVIVVKKEIIEEFQKVFERVACKVKGYILGIEALKNIFLVDNKKENTLIIDFHANSTKIGYFEYGRIKQVLNIPLGGDDITRDLAIVTKQSPELMEQVKIQNSSNYAKLRKEFAKIEIADATFEAGLLFDIINARVDEITNYIKKELESLGIYDKIESIIIIGDSIVSFEEIDILLEEILQKKLKIITKNELNIENSSIIIPIAIVKEAYDRLKLLSEEFVVTNKSLDKENVEKIEVSEENVKKVKKKGISKVLGFLGDIF